MEKPAAACYHLPGLFEFYELYRRFLPLYREHREYFYDWCTIGSIYGAPAGCIWGGGRISCGGAAAHEVLALLREYGISGRLTFSNSLLRAEHLADPQCNALCDQFAKSGSVPNGVIVHSDLLADYLRQRWPELYLVSSTTKVLTDFTLLRQELEKPQFRYVVPDFRLNPALEQLRTLPPEQKAKVEFLCNECCWFGCTERRRCYEAVSRKNLGEVCEHQCTAPGAQANTSAKVCPGPALERMLRFPQISSCTMRTLPASTRPTSSTASPARSRREPLGKVSILAPRQESMTASSSSEMPEKSAAV